MIRINKQGYTTIEQYLYEIEVNNIDYSVQVDVKLFVKPPDYSTYDSDLDFEGCTEILDIKILKVYSEDTNPKDSDSDENGNENEVEFKLLSKELQDKFYEVLDNLVINENR